MKQKAFTLIELSIVLVIIGLITGGVLVGQDLINAGKLRKAISSIDKYNTAVMAFKIKYGGLPGDIPNMASFFPSECSASASRCKGTGNKKIIRANVSGTGVLHEDLLFWSNLAWAGFIENPDFNDAAWVVNNMNVKQITSSPSILNENAVVAIMYPGEYVNTSIWWTNFSRRSHSFQIGGVGADAPAIKAWGAQIKPSDARHIDVKLDDGKPKRGNIQGEHTHTSVGSRRHCHNGSNYDLSYQSAEDGCRLRFLLNF